MNYNFEELKRIQFVVQDADNKKLGKVECTLGQVFAI